MPQDDEKKLGRRLGRDQGIGVLTWLSGVYPLIVIFLVLLSWITSYVQLGHKPRYWVDDPQRISSALSVVVAALYLLAISWFVAAMISASLWAIGLISRILQRENLWAVAIPPLAWGVLVGLVYWDPGSVLKWLAD